MSKHFQHSLIAISVICTLLVTAFLWFKRKADQIIRIPAPIQSGLRTDERELVSFDEKTHRVTIVTSSGTIKMYARNPTVRIKKDGRVTVDRHLFGFQSRLTAGIGYSDTIRGMIGYNPLYWKAFEVSLNAGFTLDKNYTFVKPYAAVGYNFYGNLLINAGINPISLFKKEVDSVAFLAVKF